MGWLVYSIRRACIAGAWLAPPAPAGDCPGRHVWRGICGSCTCEMGDLVDERRGDMDAIIEEQEEISESVFIEGGILEVLGKSGEKCVFVLLGRERFYYLDDAHLGAEGEGREIAFANHAGV